VRSINKGIAFREFSRFVYRQLMEKSKSMKFSNYAKATRLNIESPKPLQLW